MDPVLWARLIVSVGLPAAEWILNMIAQKKEVTPDEWAALKAKNATPWDQLVPGSK